MSELSFLRTWSPPEFSLRGRAEQRRIPSASLTRALCYTCALYFSLWASYGLPIKIWWESCIALLISPAVLIEEMVLKKAIGFVVVLFFTLFIAWWQFAHVGGSARMMPFSRVHVSGSRRWRSSSFRNILAVQSFTILAKLLILLLSWKSTQNRTFRTQNQL